MFSANITKLDRITYSKSYAAYDDVLGFADIARSALVSGNEFEALAAVVGNSDFSTEAAYRLGNRGDQPSSATVLDDLSREFAFEVELSARRRDLAGRVRFRRFEELGRH